MPKQSATNTTYDIEPQSSDQPITEILTPRENEIARLTSQGMTNKEIAQTLEISHWTVATHLRRIYDKTNVHRRAALSWAIRVNTKR